MPDSNTSQPQDQGSPVEPSAKPRKEIPLISVPNDREMIAEEMEELFEEDQVTHIHGGTEPEAE